MLLKFALVVLSMAVLAMAQNDSSTPEDLIECRICEDQYEDCEKNHLPNCGYWYNSCLRRCNQPIEQAPQQEQQPEVGGLLLSCEAGCDRMRDRCLANHEPDCWPQHRLCYSYCNKRPPPK